ncbi:MAG: DNA sulfur modification protein DndB [Deltaproteobacteria bacterium]|nr:DNA sulfur modification protein DndB [Deltaproteobacteria bacterium]
MPRTTSPRAAKAFEYVFPAIRGVQARREYYISMCPLRLIPRIFLFDEEELVPELRAQRLLNRARVPEIAGYIVANRDSYVFSAITASVDGELRFEAITEQAEGRAIGCLHVPMNARFVINDGQHRRAAIEAALREAPDLGDETIPVVMFLDVGLERCQQMFADLNRYAIRPATSLGVLYDHRDDDARLTKAALLKLDLFRQLTETERSTLSLRSRKLFTLSALHVANRSLFTGSADVPSEQRVEKATAFWSLVAAQFPEWRHVMDGRTAAADVRRDLLHPHGIMLQAFGRVGNALLREYPESGWQRWIKRLSKIDWRRSNARLWEGRALIGGRVSKSTNNVTLTTNAIKRQLDLPLTPEEQRVEDAFIRSGR